MKDFTPILTWAGIFAAILVGQIYLLGRRMSEPEKMVRPVEGGLTARDQEIILYYKDWLTAVGLEFRTSFKFGTINVAVFQQGNQPRYLSFMFHKVVNISAESYLEDLTILDTSNSGSIGLFPRPGAYAQSFPGVTAQEVWQRHLEGEHYLSQKFGFNFKPLNRPYEELVIAAMRVRMQFNRSQFLWPVRVLYRYFVTRHAIKNRTIARQYP